MAIWPGSSVHAREAFSNPRWEDYEYEYLDEKWNNGEDPDFLAWMGNGLTIAQEEGGKTTYYLDDVEEARSGVLSAEDLTGGLEKKDGNCSVS